MQNAPSSYFAPQSFDWTEVIQPTPKGFLVSSLASQLSCFPIDAQA